MKAEFAAILESARQWILAQAEIGRAWALSHPFEAQIAAGTLAVLLLVGLALSLRRRRVAPSESGLLSAPPEADAVVGAGIETAEIAEPVESVVSAPDSEARAAGPSELEPVAEFQPEPEPAEPPIVQPSTAEPATAEPEGIEPPPEPARVSLSERLRRTRESLVGRLGQLIGDRTVDAELLEELEVALFAADLGVRTVDSLLDEVRKRADGGDADAVRRVLREEIQAKLERVESEPQAMIPGTPHVILVLGVNGTGKTTTIGKLAARYVAEGKRVLLGAADTFRAAATEQLQAWGERAGCDVITGAPGRDPSSVAFDAVAAAVARKADVVIIDTAGRLQTKRPLMEELAKLARVIGKGLEGAPHETLLVLDANTGQNAISQARLFTEAAPVTGLVLTKLDGSAKGGVIVGLADEFGIPVRFVGVGESVEDLRDFSAPEFVEALFGS